MARRTSRRQTERAAETPALTWDERLINTLLPLKVELLGGFLVLVALLLVLGRLRILPVDLLLGFSDLLYQLFGWGIYPLALLMAIGGLQLILRKVNPRYRLRIGQIIGLELLLLASLPLTYLLSGTSLVDAYRGAGGGLVGWALAQPTLEFLGPLLTICLYGGLLVLGVMLVIGVRWQQVSRWLATVSRRSDYLAGQLEAGIPERRPLARQTPVQVIDEGPRLTRPVVLDGQRDARLPALSLLDQGKLGKLSEAEVEQKRRIVEQTLLDFNLRGEVTEVRRGPTVTQFGVEPGYLEKSGPDGQPKQVKVRVSQIAALQKDFALALAVPRLRIEAPVPGRGIVGIEIPNAEVSLVRLRTVLESQAFVQRRHPLTLALGQGVSGAPVALELNKMPHLLIAGATGSGKSVCLNAFVSCLVFNNTPEQVRLVMIDPKKVELIRFNGLPHLLGTVEVEHERVLGVLKWLMKEMDERYQLFAATGAKNLEAYNSKVLRRGEGRTLPYIVVFIDELADLMSMYGLDVERALCRLAQMARATGIHLVVATQRPSTDVLTGLIKANFPARIAFSVASGTDSRVILDSVGAEQLLGRGDMLFLSPEASEPVRVQSCLVTDNEIERIVAHWQHVMPPGEPVEAPWERLLAREAHIEETDDMLEEAIALAQEYDTLSTSFLQRRLRVGFPRAARLMEALHELGIVDDPQDGGRTRRSYADEDDDPLDRFLAEQD